MRHRPGMDIRFVGLAAALTLFLAGCTAASTTPEPPATTAPSVSHPVNPLPTGSQPVNLDPADFTLEIDHPYWPMKPGTRWTYRELDEGGEVKEVVVVVTAQTRRIANGVTARVVRDTVRVDGEIIEDTF